MAGKSPRTVAIQASLAVGLLSMAATGMAMWLSGVTQGWWLPPLLGGAVGAVSFAMIYRQLGVYIQDRVRIIYKTIRRLKGSGNQTPGHGRRHCGTSQPRRDGVGRVANLKSHSRETDTFRQSSSALAHELKTLSSTSRVHLLLEGGMEDPEINRKFLLKAAKTSNACLDPRRPRRHHQDGGQQLGHRTCAVHLLDIIRETMEAQAKAKRNDIELAAKGSIDATAVMVLGDASKIVQVLTNLIVNSINYGREGGRTEIRYFDADEAILVEVADTGIGIHENDLPRVFERFYRVDKSRSRHAGGSGLGLAIVKHILEAHDQSISVRSTWGRINLQLHLAEGLSLGH